MTLLMMILRPWLWRVRPNKNLYLMEIGGTDEAVRPSRGRAKGGNGRQRAQWVAASGGGGGGLRPDK